MALDISSVYSACLFCHASLGANEVIERFPIGRRLAFDPATGRLWVVCRACERWNLTPLEERWEAIEDCERRYRSTRLRASTPEIGLARLSEGLELVRIGHPLRPEFSAWRYGDQFGRRRIRRFAVTGVGLTALGLGVAGSAVAGLQLAGLAFSIFQVARTIVYGRPSTVVASIRVGKLRRLVEVKRQDLPNITLLPADRGAPGWGLNLKGHRLEGDKAMEALSALLPSINRSGASRQQVRDAVARIEAHETPSAYLAATIDRRRHERTNGGHWPTLIGLAPPDRLALEMALHEEDERRAMEGELARLTAAWRDAEEIAAIADDLFLPEPIHAWLRRHTITRGKSS